MHKWHTNKAKTFANVSAMVHAMKASYLNFSDTHTHAMNASYLAMVHAMKASYLNISDIHTWPTCKAYV